MSYGSNIAYQIRPTAAFVDKILKDARSADLPVEQPIKFELVVNLKTARALDISAQTRSSNDRFPFGGMSGLGRALSDYFRDRRCKSAIGRKHQLMSIG